LALGSDVSLNIISLFVISLVLFALISMR
jgi:hypothetical protein